MRTHRRMLIATASAARGSVASYWRIPQVGEGAGVVSAARVS